jgi:hypothetical protein
MAAPVVDRGPSSGWLAPDALVALAVLAVLVLAAAGAAVGLFALVLVLAVVIALAWGVRHHRRTAPWWHAHAEQRAALASLRVRHRALDAAGAAPSATAAELAVALAAADGDLAGRRAMARSLDRATVAHALARRGAPETTRLALDASRASLAADLADIEASLDRCEAERAAALAEARRELDALG